uniref:Uncharacterized protein n=1 Tax=Oryza glumipatula TaxID=40148 RepID=A0A0D9ZG96_9ORYZ
MRTPTRRGLSHRCPSSLELTLGDDVDSDHSRGDHGVAGGSGCRSEEVERPGGQHDGEDDGRNPPSLSPTKPDPPLFRHRHLSRSGHYDVGSEIGGKKVCDISSALICRHESPPLAPPPRVAPKSFACLN